MVNMALIINLNGGSTPENDKLLLLLQTIAIGYIGMVITSKFV